MKRSLDGFVVVMGLLAIGSVAAAAPGPKVTICHFSPGNPANVQVIAVGAPAVSAHVANHNDAVCPAGDSDCCFGGSRPSTCTNFATDVNNCGNCSNVCPAGATCADGSCVALTPIPTPTPTFPPTPTLTPTLATGCCEVPSMPQLGQPAPICFVTTVADVSVKCDALGGDILFGPVGCNPESGLCQPEPPPVPPSVFCCNCPLPPPAPPQVCFETDAPCPTACSSLPGTMVMPGGFTCDAVSETCVPAGP